MHTYLTILIYVKSLGLFRFAEEGAEKYQCCFLFSLLIPYRLTSKKVSS